MHSPLRPRGTSSLGELSALDLVWLLLDILGSFF
jgi:hypothetical protein